MLTVLYEDNHLIAINKRSGVLVQADKTGDKPLMEEVRDYIRDKYEKPGNVFVGVPHRIDRPVSGVILFARTSKALERLNAMFKSREMKKTYWAVVKNKPPKASATLVHYLIKNPETNVTTAYDEPVEGGQRSELSYIIKAEVNGYYLLEVSPVTGRPHQIRVQLASMNCPIRGDKKYGFSRPNSNHGINLHARYLEFMHPVKKELVKIKATLPKDDFWPQFEGFGD